MNKTFAYVRISNAATELISAFENYFEYRVARDRIGDKKFLSSHQKLVEALVSFAREIVVIARGR